MNNNLKYFQLYLNYYICPFEIVIYKTTTCYSVSHITELVKDYNQHNYKGSHIYNSLLLLYNIYTNSTNLSYVTDDDQKKLKIKSKYLISKNISSFNSIFKRNVQKILIYYMFWVKQSRAIITNKVSHCVKFLYAGFFFFYFIISHIFISLSFLLVFNVLFI